MERTFENTTHFTSLILRLSVYIQNKWTSRMVYWIREETHIREWEFDFLVFTLWKKIIVHIPFIDLQNVYNKVSRREAWNSMRDKRVRRLTHWHTDVKDDLPDSGNAGEMQKDKSSRDACSHLQMALQPTQWRMPLLPPIVVRTTPVAVPWVHLDLVY